MYEYLEGRVVARSAARLVLDVGGVGYELLTPLGAAFPEAERARVFTHLVVREDAHILYGFPDRGGRELFRLLLTVRGVGPAMALGVLSGMDRRALLAAVLEQDPRPFTRVKGVGKKTAEQILLDLRDRAARIAGDEQGAAAAAAPAAPRAEAALEDAVAAMVSIGYSDKEARKQVERAAERVDPADLEELLRAALRS